MAARSRSVTFNAEYWTEAFIKLKLYPLASKQAGSPFVLSLINGWLPIAISNLKYDVWGVCTNLPVSRDISSWLKSCWGNTHLQAPCPHTKKFDFSIRKPGYTVLHTLFCRPNRYRCTHSCSIRDRLKLAASLVVAGFKDSSAIMPAPRLDKGNAFCIIIAHLGRYSDLLSLSRRSSPLHPEKFQIRANFKGQVHLVHAATQLPCKVIKKYWGEVAWFPFFEVELADCGRRQTIER